MIVNYQWYPRQILSVLCKEGIRLSHQAIYSIIHSDSIGLLTANIRHKLKYRKHPKVKLSPMLTEPVSTQSR